MTTIGLAPKRTVTLFVKQVPALFLEDAVPEAVAAGLPFDETTYLERKSQGKGKSAGGDATTPLKVFPGGLVFVYGYRLADTEIAQPLPAPVKLVLPARPSRTTRRAATTRPRSCSRARNTSAGPPTSTPRPCCSMPTRRRSASRWG
jgi:hypothetical protein